MLPPLPSLLPLPEAALEQPTVPFVHVFAISASSSPACLPGTGVVPKRYGGLLRPPGGDACWSLPRSAPAGFDSTPKGNPDGGIVKQEVGTEYGPTPARPGVDQKCGLIYC